MSVSSASSQAVKPSSSSSSLAGAPVITHKARVSTSSIATSASFRARGSTSSKPRPKPRNYPLSPSAPRTIDVALHTAAPEWANKPGSMNDVVTRFVAALHTHVDPPMRQLLNVVLNEADVHTIADALANNRFLEDVRFSGCQLQVKSIKALTRSLALNDKLTSFAFENNDSFGNMCGKLFAEVIKVTRTLKSLRLWKDRIGAQGCSFLASALEANSSLTYLDLSVNEVGPEGGTALAEALQVNTTLRVIDLASNNIGPKAGVAFGAALATNTSLTSLNLSWNALGDEGGLAIGMALAKNRALVALNIKWNDFTDTTNDTIIDAFNSNTHCEALLISGFCTYHSSNVQRAVNVFTERNVQEKRRRREALEAASQAAAAATPSQTHRTVQDKSLQLKLEAQNTQLNLQDQLNKAHRDKIAELTTSIQFLEKQVVRLTASNADHVDEVHRLTEQVGRLEAKSPSAVTSPPRFEAGRSAEAIAERIDMANAAEARARKAEEDAHEREAAAKQAMLQADAHIAESKRVAEDARAGRVAPSDDRELQGRLSAAIAAEEKARVAEASAIKALELLRKSEKESEAMIKEAGAKMIELQKREAAVAKIEAEQRAAASVAAADEARGSLFADARASVGGEDSNKRHLRSESKVVVVPLDDKTGSRHVVPVKRGYIRSKIKGYETLLDKR